MTTALGTLITSNIETLGTTADHRVRSNIVTFDGEEEPTFAAAVSINCIIQPLTAEQAMETFGEFNGEEHIILTDTSITPQDHIIHNSVTYEITNVEKGAQHKSEGVLAYAGALKKVVPDG